MKLSGNGQEMENSSNEQTLKDRMKSFFSFNSTCQKKNFIQTICVYFNVLLLVSKS